jgi:hypothetical protein
MVVETHLDRARSRVGAEHEQVTGERRAYEQFRSEVESLQVSMQSHSTPGATTAGVVSAGTRLQSDRSSSQCRAVRDLFAETIRPHSLTDRGAGTEEPLLETIRQELGGSIAVVLSPETNHRLTPQTRAAIRSKATDRIRKLDAMERALEREADSVQSARSELESITDWLATANETSLLELGFPELRQRHETLDAHRTACETRLHDRQELLGETTSREGQVGLSHRSFVAYLYQDLSVSYPILSTFTRLDGVLADSQRAVRDHLTRRV